MSIRRRPVTRRAPTIAISANPPEASTDDRIYALEDELRLLSPYASTKGLSRLKARVDEIRLHLHRLRGLPLEEDVGL